MIIYKPEDRIPCDFGDVVITLAPLTNEQKQTAFNITKMKSGKVENNEIELAKRAIKYSVKDFTGAKNWDGTEVKLKFDKNGLLVKESVDMIMNINAVGKITEAIGKILNGSSVEEVEGVKILSEPSKKKKRQSSAT